MNINSTSGVMLKDGQATVGTREFHRHTYISSGYTNVAAINFTVAAGNPYMNFTWVYWTTAEYPSNSEKKQIRGVYATNIGASSGNWDNNGSGAHVDYWYSANDSSANIQWPSYFGNSGTTKQFVHRTGNYGAYITSHISCWCTNWNYLTVTFP